MVKGQYHGTAADSLHAGIAVLDGDGVIRWTNEAWSHAETGTTPLGAMRVGSNFVTLAKADARPLSAAILAGIAAVIAGAAGYVELQSEASVAGRPVMVAITPTRGRRGAVILYAESSAIRAIVAGAPLTIDATRIAEHLTPRELEVLTLMAAGLSNRAIASDLGIEYTTVRGHVQSLLAKLGARSRVDLVAHAYRSWLVRETDLGLDRQSRRGPGDKAADDIRGVREAQVV